MKAKSDLNITNAHSLILDNLIPFNLLDLSITLSDGKFELNTQGITSKVISAELSDKESTTLIKLLAQLNPETINSNIIQFTTSRNIKIAIHSLFPSQCFLYTLQKYIPYSPSLNLIIAGYLSTNGYPYDALVLANKVTTPTNPISLDAHDYTQVYIASYISLGHSSKALVYCTCPSLFKFYTLQSKRYAWKQALDIYNNTPSSPDLIALFIATCVVYNKPERAWIVYEAGLKLRNLNTHHTGYRASFQAQNSVHSSPDSVGGLVTYLPSTSTSHHAVGGTVVTKGVTDAILKCILKNCLDNRTDYWEARMWSVYSHANVHPYKPILLIMEKMRSWSGLGRVWSDYKKATLYHTLHPEIKTNMGSVYEIRDTRIEEMFLGLFLKSKIYKDESEEAYERIKDSLSPAGFKMSLEYFMGDFRKRVLWDKKCFGIEITDLKDESDLYKMRRSMSELSVVSSVVSHDLEEDSEEDDLVSREEAVMILESWIIQLFFGVSNGNLEDVEILESVEEGESR